MHTAWCSETPVLLGKDENKSIVRLACFQGVLYRIVVYKFGWQYPVWVVKEVEVYREGWFQEAIWDYLGVTAP